MSKKLASKKPKKDDSAVVEEKGVISLRVEKLILPVAIKVGQRLYRVCPVCGEVFTTATGWRKHMNRYHRDFLMRVEDARIAELNEILEDILGYPFNRGFTMNVVKKLSQSQSQNKPQSSQATAGDKQAQAKPPANKPGFLDYRPY